MIKNLVFGIDNIFTGGSDSPDYHMGEIYFGVEDFIIDKEEGKYNFIEIDIIETDEGFKVDVCDKYIIYMYELEDITCEARDNPSDRLLHRDLYTEPKRIIEPSTFNSAKFYKKVNKSIIPRKIEFIHTLLADDKNEVLIHTKNFIREYIQYKENLDGDRLSLQKNGWYEYFNIEAHEERLEILKSQYR